MTTSQEKTWEARLGLVKESMLTLSGAPNYSGSPWSLLAFPVLLPHSSKSQISYHVIAKKIPKTFSSLCLLGPVTWLVEQRDKQIWVMKAMFNNVFYLASSTYVGKTKQCLFPSHKTQVMFTRSHRGQHPLYAWGRKINRMQQQAMWFLNFSLDLVLIQFCKYSKYSKLLEFITVQGGKVS